MKVAELKRPSYSTSHYNSKMVWAIALSLAVHILGIHLILRPLMRNFQERPEVEICEISRMEIQLIKEPPAEKIPLPVETPAKAILKNPLRVRLAPKVLESQPAVNLQSPALNPVPGAVEEKKITVEEAEIMFKSLSPEQKKQVILNGSNMPAPFSGLKGPFNKGILKYGLKGVCHDKVDNDDDGKIDEQDPDCWQKNEYKKKLLLY